MTQLEIFSRNLKIYMEARQKKQSDLCKYMNVSSATVSDWCNGKKMPKTQRIGDIANWLHIEVTDLFNDVEPDEKKLTITADSELSELIELLNNATPEQKKTFLQLAKALLLNE